MFGTFWEGLGLFFWLMSVFCFCFEYVLPVLSFFRAPGPDKKTKAQKTHTTNPENGLGDRRKDREITKMMMAPSCALTAVYPGLSFSILEAGVAPVLHAVPTLVPGGGARAVLRRRSCWRQAAVRGLWTHGDWWAISAQAAPFPGARQAKGLMMQGGPSW